MNIFRLEKGKHEKFPFLSQISVSDVDVQAARLKKYVKSAIFKNGVAIAAWPLCYLTSFSSKARPFLVRTRCVHLEEGKREGFNLVRWHHDVFSIEC